MTVRRCVKPAPERHGRAQPTCPWARARSRSHAGSSRRTSGMPSYAEVSSRFRTRPGLAIPPPTSTHTRIHTHTHAHVCELTPQCCRNCTLLSKSLSHNHRPKVYTQAFRRAGGADHAEATAAVLVHAETILRAGGVDAARAVPVRTRFHAGFRWPHDRVLLRASSCAVCGHNYSCGRLIVCPRVPGW